jgi:hypothetical protein
MERANSTVNALFKIEVFEPEQILLFRLPHTINNILDVQHIICLTVSSISERHIWGVGLRNWRKSKMWWP